MWGQTIQRWIALKWRDNRAATLMRKGRYKDSVYKSSLGNYGWGRVLWTTDLGKCKTADLVQESKRRFGLVVRLKAIDHYGRFHCYLSFLSLLNGLLIVWSQIVTKFLFVRLVEVVGRRHSPWNPNDLISSDLFWSVLIWSKSQNLTC